MRVSRLIGGGLGVVLAIALSAATSVSPLMHPEQPASREAAVVAQLGVALSGARLTQTRTHAPLVAWSN